MSEEQKDQEIAELKFALRAKDVDARLAALKSQGKVVPASEEFARQILLRGDQLVEFSDGEATVGELFLRFLEAQPKVIEFVELTPGKAGPEARPLLSADEEELLSKLGISREMVDKYAEDLSCIPYCVGGPALRDTQYAIPKGGTTHDGNNHRQRHEAQ